MIVATVTDFTRYTFIYILLFSTSCIYLILHVCLVCPIQTLHIKLAYTLTNMLYKVSKVYEGVCQGKN